MQATHQRSINWRTLLLEAFFIVLGVVLALGANDWREQRSNVRHAATALESIRDELETNRQAVDNALAYHAHLSDTLRIYLRPASQRDGATPAPQPNMGIFRKGFISPAITFSTAWQAAHATGAISYMAYDDVLLLSRIYESQRQYYDQHKLVGQNIYTTLFNEGYAGMLRNIENLQFIIVTFMYQECQLLEHYNEVLPQLPTDEPTVEYPPVPTTCAFILGRR